MTPARRMGEGTRPRLFVELCCGSAAVTLKLLGGRYAVPPISYMGSKRGYAHAILWAMGLRQGQGADRVLLCDAGPWGHVWGVLVDRDRCLLVASIIRGWKDEDPRQLWERLREEHRGAWDGWTAERVAGWHIIEGWSYAQGSQTPKLNEVKAYGGEAAGHPEYAWKPQTPEKFATRLESVAAWLTTTAWSGGGRVTQYQGPDRPSACHGDGWVACIERDGIADRLTPPTAPISVYPGSAADIEPPDDCDGVFCMIDPPYQGTTGYSVDLPRADVLAICQRWSDAGAVVCCCEAEPLDLDGWHHQEITSTRQGQKRTFSKQQREWLTLNREPAWRPAVQREMFP